jgi:uncharacterized protein (DUF1330 family)
MTVLSRLAAIAAIVFGSVSGLAAQEAKGPAYSIVNLKSVTDPDAFNTKYVPGHLPSVAKFGGKFIVVARSHEMIEGDKVFGPIIIHQWPDKETFHAWYDSGDYKPWREIRHAASEADVILVAGMAPADPVDEGPGRGISVVDVRIADPGKFFGEYVPGHMPSIEKFGGKFLSAGPDIEVIEGDWAPSTVVIHQFPSVAVWKEWYASPDYAPWREIRHSVSEADVALTESMSEAVKAERKMP